MEQREQDVVVLPVRVMTKREFRIVLLDSLDLVTSHEADLVPAQWLGPVVLKCLQTPVENPAVVYLGKTLGIICRGRHQATPAASTNYDHLHWLSLPSIYQDHDCRQ